MTTVPGSKMALGPLGAGEPGWPTLWEAFAEAGRAAGGGYLGGREDDGCEEHGGEDDSEELDP